MNNGDEGFQLVGSPIDTDKCDKSTVCHGYVAVSTKRNAIVVAFRGTEGNVQLVAEIVEALQEKVPMAGGKTFKYFYDAMAILYPNISTYVNQQLTQNPTYEVWVTGHSLGGAVASLAATQLRLDGVVSADKLKLITYGQPRVGGATFAKAHDRLIPYSFRVTHYLDLVPHIPPCLREPGASGCVADQSDYWGYHHGSEVWFDAEIMTLYGYKLCPGNPENEDMGCSDGQWQTGYSTSDHVTYYNGTFPFQC